MNLNQVTVPSLDVEKAIIITPNASIRLFMATNTPEIVKAIVPKISTT